MRSQYDGVCLEQSEKIGMNLLNSSKTLAEMILENFLSVQERMERAAQRAGRNREEIQLIGVTKYVDSTVTRLLVEAGCSDLGESRPQSIWEKSASLKDLEVRWHLIGHLQRNKVKRTIPLLSVMHSLDSDRILQHLIEEIGVRPNPLRLLLEINVSGDAEKTGLSISEGEQLLDRWLKIAADSQGLRIVGLMGMGSATGGLERARCDFEALRKLRDRWAIRFGMPLKELSMGMSDDFEIAIEQGATMVRVGSVLFANIDTQ